MAVAVLEEVRDQLIEGLGTTVIRQLLSDLRSKGVFSKEEADTIKEENPSRAEEARKLIDSVSMKGAVASKILLERLKARDKILYDSLNLDDRLGLTSTRPGHVTVQSQGEKDEEGRNKSIQKKEEPVSGDVSSDGNKRKEYKMESNPRGLCLIINNVDFLDPRDKRYGSNVDADALKKVFEDLGFKVQLKNNQTAQKMKDLMQDYSKRVQGDCFVCCILSHGELGGIYGTDMEICSINDILSPFNGINCSNMAGKPKVFFLQACRGANMQERVLVSDSVKKNDDRLTSDAGRFYSIPAHSDFLISRSTVENFVAIRNEKYGSWYIQSLCKQLKTGSERGDDILTILTDVNEEVSKREGTVEIDKKYYDAKSIPEHYFSLRKKLIFRSPKQI